MEIKVEDIMAELKAKAAERKYPAEVLTFDEIQVSPAERPRKFSGSDYSRELGKANILWHVEPGVPAGNPIKRVLRKILSKIGMKLVGPMVVQQNDFNGTVVRELNEIQRADLGQIQDLDDEVDELKGEIQELKAQLEELKKELAAKN